MTGLLIGLVPALVWGTMPLLLAVFVKSNNRVQMLGTGVGIFLISSLVTLIAQPPMASPQAFLLYFLSGFFWMIGMFGQFIGLKTIGSSKTFPLSVGLQVIVNAFLGWLILHEWSGIGQIAQGLFGVVITLLGILLCNTAFPMKKMTKEEFKPTVIVAFTTLGYCMYSLLPKLSPVDNVLTPLFPQAVGIIVAGLFFTVIMKNTGDPIPKKEALRASLVGVCYGVATLTYLVSVQWNGMVNGFLLGQLNLILATLIGIYVLHEKRKITMLQTYIGLAAILAGCVIILLI